MKVASQDMIKARVLRSGDGSHPYSKAAKEDAELAVDNNNTNFSRDTDHFWGYGKKYCNFF